MSGCGHNTPSRLSPATVDELAGELHPDTITEMLPAARVLAAGGGPAGAGWQMLADALTEAREIAVASNWHHGRPRW